jgi:hypothetical protein
MKQSCPTLEQCCHNKIRWRNAKNFVQLGICGTLMYFDKSGYGACLLALPALKPIFNEKNNAEEKALACYVEAQNERLAKLIKLAAEKDLRIKE